MPARMCKKNESRDRCRTASSVASLFDLGEPSGLIHTMGELNDAYWSDDRSGRHQGVH
jgi:hypothetical protein